MHPLKAYLQKHGLTAEAFVKKVAKHGVKTTAGYVGQIVIGHRYPSRALAAAIAAATKDEVTVGALMEFDAEKASA